MTKKKAQGGDDLSQDRPVFDAAAFAAASPPITQRCGTCIDYPEVVQAARDFLEIQRTKGSKQKVTHLYAAMQECFGYALSYQSFRMHLRTCERK